MGRKYQHWTMAQLAKAADMRASGASYSEIGRHLGRHNYSVRRALRDYGRDTHVLLSHEVPAHQRIVRKAFILRNQRYTYPEIAAEVGWDRSPTALRMSVVRFARRNELPLYVSRVYPSRESK